MLCRRCRRQVGRRDAFCPSCGTAVLGRDAAFELVLPDASRVPLAGVVTIGRAPGSTLRLDDRTVSRRHARVLAAGAVPVVEDVGSSHGTLVDGRPVSGAAPLRDGSRIGVGDVELLVERRRSDAEAGRTIVVPAGGSIVVTAVGAAEVQAPATEAGFRPRARSGFRLKRLESDEGDLRWVLRGDRSAELVRMDDDQAALFQLLDGEHALPDLLAEAERRAGSAGVGRLAQLLASLGERGLLEGVEGQATRDGGALARLVRPRELATARTGPLFERLYRRGGWTLFTPVGLALVGAVALAGLAAFVTLIVQRGGTPFVVAQRIGIGALVFILGRFAVVAVHEVAHALTMASFGRPVPRAGAKAILGIPFAFVDTSDGWFEPRRRRLAISAAGPVSDLAVGGAAALAALSIGAGNLRDVLYQVALAAYVGALFNINPFLDRDGYHMMVDLLRQPGLRRRAREWLARRLAGRPVEESPGRAVAVYGVASLGWLVLAAGFVIILTLVYLDRLESIAPPEAVWSVLGAFYLLLFVPVVLVVARPLRERRRARSPEAPGAVG